ncbi:hypothetical protein [Nocardioides malaquae]|uniref:hypothetical protein n=1 Tax=Nocardioides malaquae TaxID=2773426 RepID=UPI001D0CE515|nr:hypothetical protein [Nocardioides malaquae]
MSSLQCPATLLVAACGAVAEASAAEVVRDWYAQLAHRRVASVWSAPSAGARAVARDLSVRLGCPVQLRPDLDDGVPGQGAASTLREVLQEAADLHRGETVLVLLGAATPGDALERIVGGTSRGHRDTDLVELEVDEEWRVVTGPDRPSP